MSPSQWQLSGSCLPLLCSLVHTLRMSQYKEDPKIQVRNKSENARYYSTNHNISTIRLGTEKLLCLQRMELLVAIRTALLRREPTKNQQTRIESSSVYENWRIQLKSKVTVNGIKRFHPRISTRAEIDACSILWCQSSLKMKKASYMLLGTKRTQTLRCSRKALLPLQGN